MWYFFLSGLKNLVIICVMIGTSRRYAGILAEKRIKDKRRREKEFLMEKYLERQMMREEICEVRVENNLMIVRPNRHYANAQVSTEVLKTEFFQLIGEHRYEGIKEIVLLDTLGFPILLIELP